MLSQFSTSELEGMIEKFPYFQQAHLLLAKKYQQENSPKFDQQLQLAALYIQDRELLYSLFNEKNAVKPSHETSLEPQEEEKETIEEVKQVDQSEVQKEIIVEQEDISSIENIEISHPESIAQALSEIKQTMEAIQQISEESRTEEPLLPVEIVEIINEPEPEEKTAVAENPLTELSTASFEVPKPEIEAKEETTLIETAEETPERDTVSPKIFSRIEPHTFDEWLNAFNNKSGGVKPEKLKAIAEEPAVKDELTQLFAENITVDYLHGLVKEETNYAKGLERFIEEQKQKHKQSEKKEKTPENVPEPELVTETMAKVYEMQKKYTKAIDVYEALALKFPEKSSLFAARINFLKNIL